MIYGQIHDEQTWRWLCHNSFTYCFICFFNVTCYNNHFIIQIAVMQKTIYVAKQGYKVYLSIDKHM